MAEKADYGLSQEEFEHEIKTSSLLKRLNLVRHRSLYLPFSRPPVTMQSIVTVFSGSTIHSTRPVSAVRKISISGIACTEIPARLSDTAYMTSRKKRVESIFRWENRPINVFERVEELKLLYGMSEDKLFPGISVLLRGSALRWYRKNRSKCKPGTNSKRSLNISVCHPIITYGWKMKLAAGKLYKNGSNYVIAFQTLVEECPSWMQKENCIGYIETFNHP